LVESWENLGVFAGAKESRFNPETDAPLGGTS